MSSDAYNGTTRTIRIWNHAMKDIFNPTPTGAMKIVHSPEKGQIVGCDPGMMGILRSNLPNISELFNLANYGKLLLIVFH